MTTYKSSGSEALHLSFYMFLLAVPFTNCTCNLSICPVYF